MARATGADPLTALVCERDPMKRNCLLAVGLALVVAGCGDNAGPTDTNTSPDLASQSLNAVDRYNVLLKGPATAAQRGELQRYGTIYGEIPQINAVLMRVKAGKVDAIRALPFVAGLSQDQPRNAPPGEVVEADAFVGLDPHNVWNLDAINITNWDGSYDGPAERLVPQNGSGVLVAVLDSGLMPFWPFYFAGKDIDVANSTSLLGGGASDNGTVVSSPGKWQRDTDGHGTHVTSIILGFQYAAASTGGAFQIEGVAPDVTVVVVKVLNNGGGGWTSGIAQGVVYATDLTQTGGPHAGKRLVINESLGGSELDVIEQAALDYAIDHGAVVVAAAGNAGPEGDLTYPGAYHRVISVASAGWTGEWNTGGEDPDAPNPDPTCAPLPIPQDVLLPTRFWRQCDVQDPYASSNFYISEFSGRDPDGLEFESDDAFDLDVAAPGSWVVGPYGFNNGQINYAFVGGTSQATPHVTGIVALMLQKNPSLTAAQIEACLEDAAQPLTDSDQQVIPLAGLPVATPESWNEDRAGHGFITADAALSSDCF